MTGSGDSVVVQPRTTITGNHGADARRVPVGTIKHRDDGYTLVKTEQGWRYVHHLVVEQRLGRPLTRAERRIRFADGDKSNLDPANLLIPTALGPVNITNVPRRTRRSPRVEVPLGDLTGRVQHAAAQAGMTVPQWIVQAITNAL